MYSESLERQGVLLDVFVLCKVVFVVRRIFGYEKELLNSLICFTCFTCTCHKVANSVLNAGVIKIDCKTSAFGRGFLDSVLSNVDLF